MDSSYLIQTAQAMLDGAKITVLIFVMVITVSIPLGFIVTLLGKTPYKPVTWLINIYITVMRGTPLILQIFFVYFVVPHIPPYITFDRINAALVAFILNYAAYFAEIFRGGLLAIDKGQSEAAKVLGLNKLQTYIHIIIPQMVRVSLPSLSNEAITLVKDTSLVYVIGVAEISYVAKTAVSKHVSIMPFVMAGILYLLLILILTIALRLIEKKFRYTSKSL